MQKLWAVLFGLVLLACFLSTAAALTVYKDQWGLPSNIAEEYGGIGESSLMICRVVFISSKVSGSERSFTLGVSERTARLVSLSRKMSCA